MKTIHINWKRTLYLLMSPIFLISIQGCVATRDWVTEQISPLAGRVSNTEGQLGQMGNRLSGTEGRLGQIDAKAEKALSSLGNLRLERRFVLDLREGANFAFNATSLTDQAKREIGAFFSDLKGDVEEMNSAVYLVAGHTDSVGSEDYNYELGRKRAESVARYLITHKKVDPLRDRYLFLSQVLRVAQDIRYQDSKEIVAEFRDFWRSQPFLMIPNLDEIARQCDEVLEKLEKGR